jgi:hypothetical protein
MVLGRRRGRPADPVDEIDPSALPPRYRGPVVDALAARRRFDELVATLHPGPLQDRMGELRSRVDAGVLAVWRSATRAVELERVVDTLGAERIADELKQARRHGADPAVVDTLALRFASTQRLLNALEDLREHLPVVEARLGTAVARAAELALTSPAAAGRDELSGLEADLDTLIFDLDALSRATTELG